MILATSVASHAQDYFLVEPTGVVTADVFIDSGVMTVNDVSGVQYLFYRDRSFDSIDRTYAGYWLPSLNRIVRFPRSGVGLLQVADLDDVVPRYTFSRRSIRPAGNRRRGPAGRRRGIHSPFLGYQYLPPRFFSPYGVPAYGYYSFGTTLNVFPSASVGPLRGLPLAAPGFQSRVINSSVQARAPLTPVTVELVNSSGREVLVTVADSVDPNGGQQVRLRPGETKPVQLVRDAGADRIRRVMTYAPDGSEVIRQRSSFIPPSSRYELVVHEWRLQSVAIDRTGKSPNPIEDAQFQGRGLGRFRLPPGDQLRSGRIDVVRVAVESGNEGSIAPIVEKDASSLRPMTPLEQMLQQQRAAQRDKQSP